MAAKPEEAKKEDLTVTAKEQAVVEAAILKDAPAGGELNGKTVVYTGQATKRQITKAEWALLDIESESTVWSARNKFSIPTANFTPEQLEVLREDGWFKAGE